MMILCVGVLLQKWKCIQYTSFIINSAELTKIIEAGNDQFRWHRTMHQWSQYICQNVQAHNVHTQCKVCTSINYSDIWFEHSIWQNAQMHKNVYTQYNVQLYTLNYSAHIILYSYHSAHVTITVHRVHIIMDPGITLAILPFCAESRLWFN